jgi:type I restriction enzyme R subunit
MNLHREINFEEEICEHLGANGWLYAEEDAGGYDRARALFPADVVAWVRVAQPEAWKTLEKNHGAQAEATLLERLRDQIDQRGTLSVLRHGIELLGLRQPLKLAEFKPAMAMNADILARYEANRLRVVRQVRYSPHNENSLDLVLFLNGVPVATAELKTDFQQSIEDAVDQYRFDRLPRPAGQEAEPLLSFPHGADDNETGGSGDEVSALQSRRRRSGGESAKSEGSSHGLPMGGCVGAGELAGDSRALSHRAT